MSCGGGKMCATGVDSEADIGDIMRPTLLSRHPRLPACWPGSGRLSEHDSPQREGECDVFL